MVFLVEVVRRSPVPRPRHCKRTRFDVLSFTFYVFALVIAPQSNASKVEANAIQGMFHEMPSSDSSTRIILTFSLWHPTWTATSLAELSNIHHVEAVLFAIDGFICEETEITIVTSKLHPANHCDEVLNQTYPPRRSLRPGYAPSRRKRKLIRSLAITPGATIEVSEHRQKGIIWTTWTVHYYVTQLEHPLSDGRLPIDLGEDYFNQDSAIEAIESFVQFSLESSIKRGEMDERLQNEGAFLSVVGNEFKTFKRKLKQRYHQNKWIEDFHPTPWSLRLTGIVMLVLTFSGIVILRRVAARSHFREMKAKSEDRSVLATEEGVNRMLDSGRNSIRTIMQDREGQGIVKT